MPKVLPTSPRSVAVTRLPARRELRLFVRRLMVVGVLLLLVLGAGTGGLAATEGVSAWRGFLEALDTVATVGSYPPPPDVAGQVVRVGLIVLGVGTLIYALVATIDLFVAGHLSELLLERRMQKTIDSLNDHYLVCGFGRVGRQVAHDLRASGAPFVVVDDNPANRELADAAGVRFVEGSPSDDEVLRRAGIERARAVLACVDSDAENIFITLSARGMRSDIAIVARAAVEDSEQKLRRAGADRVVSPYKSSGAEMARLALHPQVTGVVDVAADYRMEEILVSPGSDGAGHTIGDVRGGSFIVALRRADGGLLIHPPSDTALADGDMLMAIGTARTLERLERLFTPTPTTAGPA
jgi:voltage-gated potassium channel